METLEYRDLNPYTGYHGILANHGKTAYVMQGPPVTFAPLAEEKPQGQAEAKPMRQIKCDSEESRMSVFGSLYQRLQSAHPSSGLSRVHGVTNKGSLVMAIILWNDEP